MLPIEHFTFQELNLFSFVLFDGLGNDKWILRTLIQYEIVGRSGNISNMINFGFFKVNTYNLTLSKSNFCMSLVPES